MINLKMNPNRPGRLAHFGPPINGRLVRGLACGLFVAWIGGNLAFAANVLVNPGFETSPALTGWSVHTTEGWSINGANTAGQLYRTGNNALWTQGLYGNGGAPRYYNMYAYQKLAAAPGSTYTADAW